MTKSEFEKRLSKDRTGTIAMLCLFCGNIDEVESLFSDGHTCSLCGRHTKPIGYLKPSNAPKRQHIQHEAAEQEALFRWANYQLRQYPELVWLYACPNGGSRNKAEAANLKRQGVKAGIPDICLPVARGGYHGLYIELKAGKNKPTDKQKECIAWLRSQGYMAEVCVGWQQAAELITKYLTLEESK